MGVKKMVIKSTSSNSKIIEWNKQSNWIADFDSKGQSLSRMNVDHLNETQIDFIRHELDKNNIANTICSGVTSHNTSIRVTGQENIQKLMNILEKPVSLYGPRRR